MKKAFQSIKYNRIQNNFGIIVFIVGLVFQTNTGMAQNNLLVYNGFGFSFDTYVSGNAHGIMSSGILNYTKNKTTISLGPCIQKRHMKLCGGKMSVAFLLNAPRMSRTNLLKTSSSELSDEDALEEDEEEEMADNIGATTTNDRCQIKLLAFVQYIGNASFSYAAEKMEYHVNRIENMNWSAARLSTVECGLGFEVNTKIIRNLYWRKYITATVFNHVKSVQNMHHDQYALTLTIGTSITIPYFRS